MDNSQHWQHWLEVHGPKLVLFARRWSTDHADAEDIVQDAFVRFWQTRDRVDDPLAYLYQCVRNVAIDAARSRQARIRREASIMAEATVPALVDTLNEEELAKHVESALTKLPPEQAEVVTLKIWGALTFAQIAEVTSTPAGTVASRYRYAMNRLRQTLEKSELT